MNILEICDDYPPFTEGGVGNTVFALVQEWKRIGVNVHVLCVGSGRYASTRSEAGLTVTRIPRPDIPPRPLWFQIKGLRLLQPYLAGADIVHGHVSSCALMAMANRTPKRPWVVTVHGLPRRTFPLYLLRPVAGRVFRDDLVYTLGFPLTESLFRLEQCLADHLVFVSRHDLNDAHLLYGASLAGKSSSIWAPVGESGFTYGAKPRTKRFTYAYVGRLYWHKGVNLLLNAFGRLVRQNGDVVLRLYGGLTGGPLEGMMRRRVRELGLGNCVEFKGWMKHEEMLSEISSEVDVMVHPSLYEACPIAVLEAMSLGKPIIVSDLPWSQEFVTDGATGLRTKFDESSLCSQMKELRENNELRSHLGTNARAFIKSGFHPEVIAREYLNLFDKLVADPGDHRQRD
ncbi:MAG: glycosyltransferase family 4 protein [Candidatus Bathyarchaeia archaeon]